MTLRIDVQSPYDLGLRSRQFMTSHLEGRWRLEELLADGTVQRVGRGWYIRSTRWAEFNSDQRHLAKLYTQWLSLKEPRPVAHSSAATLLGIFQIGRDPKLHLASDHHRCTTSGHRITKEHVRTLPELDVVLVHGIPTTGLTETLVDCAMSMQFLPGLVVADQLAHRGADLSLVAEWMQTTGRRRGIARLRKVMEFVDPDADSAGETLTRILIVEWRLPMPVSQYEIWTEKGLFRADFAWPEFKVILEFDGAIKYDGTRPTDVVLLAERQRELALQAEGWTIIRTTWDEVRGNSLPLRRRLERALGLSAGW